MDLIMTIKETQSQIQKERMRGKTIGFVPTMGALHQGHKSLVERSVHENDFTVVSIFVNPTQFGPKEDFGKYPRTLDDDQALLTETGADLLFFPSPEEMYPTGRPGEIRFGLQSMDKVLCGASRPGHFDGVVQVVTKLLNIAQPHRAYFGEKDFQQLSILKTLAQELFFPIEVIGCPIIREPDGLAMSSRNRYLNSEERKQAIFLKESLEGVKVMAKQGKSASECARYVQAAAGQFPQIRLDYFEIRTESGLETVRDIQQSERPRAFIAAFCGTTRLIDNIPLYD